MLRKLSYRPDIDGLRALAVLTVALFHINPNYMPSGFLGVDIFFVISGYLITSIIYREMAEGTFTFANFYNRRIKRILPVFFVVILTGLLVVWLMFSVGDYWKMANSAIFSVLFISNIYFARGVGYFDVGTEENPFNHIWSLSVEEQFYFIFPIVLLFIFKQRFLNKHKLFTLIVIGAISLILSFIDLKKIGIGLDVYYLPHLRMIELLVGSVLSIYLFENGNKLSQKQSDILGVLSLVVLLCCLVVKDFFLPPFFPGFLALLPCVAVALLILANEKGKYITKLFSLSPIVWIGKISYSLYLWHWIVLAIFRYFFGTGVLSNTNLLIAIPLMFGLSVLSYYGVEQPFRHIKYSFKKSFILFYIIPAILVFGVSRFLRKESDWPTFLPIKCNQCDSGEDLTQIGNINSLKGKKILLVGDSHAEQIVPFIDVIGKKEGWKASVLAKSDCPSILETEEYDESKLSDYYKCIVSRKYFQENYKSYDIFILSNYYSWRKEVEPYIIERFEQTIQTLLSQNKKVYIVKSCPSFDVDMQRIENLEKLGIKREVNLVGNTYRSHIETWTQIKELLQQKYPQVHIIDLLPYIPKDGRINGRNIMFNIDHLNSYGAEEIAKKFIRDGKTFLNEEDLK